MGAWKCAAFMQAPAGSYGRHPTRVALFSELEPLLCWAFITRGLTGFLIIFFNTTFSDVTQDALCSSRFYRRSKVVLFKVICNKQCSYYGKLQ